MLSAKSITVPFICEQTKCFGSEGTINYKDSLMDCCIKWAVFLNQIAWGKDFFSINEPFLLLKLEVYSIYITVKIVLSIEIMTWLLKYQWEISQNTEEQFTKQCYMSHSFIIGCWPFYLYFCSHFYKCQNHINQFEFLKFLIIKVHILFPESAYYNICLWIFPSL